MWSGLHSDSFRILSSFTVAIVFCSQVYVTKYFSSIQLSYMTHKSKFKFSILSALLFSLVCEAPCHCFCYTRFIFFFIAANTNISKRGAHSTDQSQRCGLQMSRKVLMPNVLLYRTDHIIVTWWDLNANKPATSSGNFLEVFRLNMWITAHECTNVPCSARHTYMHTLLKRSEGCPSTAAND